MSLLTYILLAVILILLFAIGLLWFAFYQVGKFLDTVAKGFGRFR